MPTQHHRGPRIEVRTNLYSYFAKTERGFLRVIGVLFSNRISQKLKALLATKNKKEWQ
jgi:hypothetical protein